MRTLIGAVAALMVTASPAWAVLQIAGDIGGTTFFCADNDLTCDTAPATGVLQIADQTINGVVVNSSIQTSTKGTSNILNTSSLSLINNSGSDKTIIFTVGDTSFVGPIASFATAGSGTWQNADGSTLTLQFANDPANVQGADFAGDVPGSIIDTFSDTAVGAADAFSHSNSGAVTDPALFSMTLNASGTLVNGGQLINRGQTEIKNQTVIEPTSLALLGSGLLMLGLVRRWKA